MTADVPRWFADSGVMPSFATESEMDREYRRYLASVEQEQFHGIRLGENPGEVVVLFEKPGLSTMMQVLDPFVTFDWQEPTDALVLAKTMLRHSLDPDKPHHAVEVDDVAVPFSERIVQRFARAEWTLSKAFIRQWIDLIRSNT